MFDDDDFEIHDGDIPDMLDSIKDYIGMQEKLVFKQKRELNSEKEFSRVALERIRAVRDELELLKSKNLKLENDLIAKVEENAKLQSRVNQLGKMTTGVGVFSEKDLKRLCQYLHPDRTGRDTQDLFRIFKSKLDGVRND